MRKKYLSATLSVRIRSEHMAVIRQMSQEQQVSPAEIVRKILDREFGLPDEDSEAICELNRQIAELKLAVKQIQVALAKGQGES